MKNNSKLLMAAAAVAIIFSACKKETTTGSTDRTNTEKLTNKNWFTTATTASPGITTSGGTSTDLFAEMGACERDDYDRFSTNGTYVTDEGLTKCDTADLQATPGTWAFTSNETKILIDGGLTYNVVKLESGTFIYSYNLVILGVMQTITVTKTSK